MLSSTTLLCGYFILIQIIFNHFYAWTSNPGYSRDIRCNVDRVGSTKVGLNIIFGEPKLSYKNFVTLWSRKCKKCGESKPERAHHCSVCGTCVLMMDHHCPWINNCVGWANHRYFFLFCFWTTVGALYVVGFSFDVMFYISLKDTRFWRFFSFFYSSSAYDLPIFTRRYLQLVFYLCLTVSVALGGLTAFHIFLISTGQTSIERVQRKTLQASEYSYSHGIAKNWILFFNIRRYQETDTYIMPIFFNRAKLDFAKLFAQHC